jgi:Profilin
MTSWQDYVNNQLVGTGNLATGAILGSSDGAVWACSPGNLNPEDGPSGLALTNTSHGLADVRVCADEDGH